MRQPAPTLQAAGRRVLLDGHDRTATTIDLTTSTETSPSNAAPPVGAGAPAGLRLCGRHPPRPRRAALRLQDQRALGLADRHPDQLRPPAARPRRRRRGHDRCRRPRRRRRCPTLRSQTQRPGGLPDDDDSTYGMQPDPARRRRAGRAGPRATAGRPVLALFADAEPKSAPEDGVTSSAPTMNNCSGTRTVSTGRPPPWSTVTLPSRVATSVRARRTELGCASRSIERPDEPGAIEFTICVSSQPVVEHPIDVRSSDEEVRTRTRPPSIGGR